MSRRTDVPGNGAAPLILNAEEQRIVDQFVGSLRAMDEETCGEVVHTVLYMTETMASKNPRHKRPALRLVGGAR